VKNLTPGELRDLTTVAQQRNGRESITGLMLYDNSRFFQWLEGPPDSVGRVMGSIQNDPRHCNLEVLNVQSVQGRQFAGWNMKLATPVPINDSWRSDVIAPPPEIVDDLRKRPEAAPSLLLKLVPVSAGSMADPVSAAPLSTKAADILRKVFINAVVPQLNVAHAPQDARTEPATDPRVAELAELLLATDQQAVRDLMLMLQDSGGVIGPISASLFEPAARFLGDLWSEDSCTEFDVTLGLCRLQTAARLLTAGTMRTVAHRLPKPVVLITPEPGELHRLGAVLDTSVLEQAGWAPHTEFPLDDDALDELLSAAWFDVLDLSLSTAFRREDVLPRVTRTIELARRASRNPALVVVVGGRVFKEEKNAGSAVGADHANTTSLGVNRSILKTISAARNETKTPVPTPA
jgi:methanogenic corrinoid protein MtbC1